MPPPRQRPEKQQRTWDAIKCDCCGGLIRVGEVKFSLGMGQTILTICNDCKGDLVSSAEIHGVEDEIYL